MLVFVTIVSVVVLGGAAYYSMLIVLDLFDNTTDRS